MNKKTYQPKQNEVKRDWHLIDAKGKILGRISTEIAVFLMGKHKSAYSNHMDVGDFVVVVNAKEVVLTGKKQKQKVYIRHSGYPGGLKQRTFEQVIASQPEKVIESAVSGMLPDNRLKDKRMTRLKIFAGADNKYQDKFTMLNHAKE